MGDELGTLVERYEVNNGRRGRNAAVFLLCGLISSPLAVMLAIPAFESSTVGDDLVPSVLLGCCFGLVLMGCWFGWLFLSRPGETFELYEHGVVHAKRRARGERRAVRWADVTELTDFSKNHALARAFGGDVSLRIRHSGGKPIQINGLVNGAEQLTMTIRAAVDNGNRPRPT